MTIKELQLRNFGKFSGAHFTFSDGINVICGANEAGKTTMYQGIGALLFGMDKQRGRGARNDAYTTYQPWINKTWYEGSLKFETGGKIFCLGRSFYHYEKSVHLFCETDGEELSVEKGDLEMLLGGTDAGLYFNTAAVGQLKMKPQDMIYDYLQNYIAGVQENGKYATDVVKALELLENQKKALEKEKKKQSEEILRQITMLEAGMELVEKEILECEKGLEQLKLDRKKLEDQKIPKGKSGFWARILSWFRLLFFRARVQKEKQQKREALLKTDEKIKFFQELLGEKECQIEEFLIEKEALYVKLHEQSKAGDIRALELAMERIRELSALRKEEILAQLLDKTSKVLSQITKGKYQKLLFGEDGAPTVWDGQRTVKMFQLSTGCVDQVYLSLRIGLQELFFEEESMPLLFDDAFVHMDDERLTEILKCFREMNRQILIFTCHKREFYIMEKLGIAHKKILL